MPIVQISLIQGRTPEKKEQLIKKVTDAIVEVLQVPADRIQIPQRSSQGKSGAWWDPALQIRFLRVIQMTNSCSELLRKFNDFRTVYYSSK